MQDLRKKSLALACGVVFNSLTEFSEYLGVSLASISKALSRGDSADEVAERARAKQDKRRLAKEKADKRGATLVDLLARGAKHPEGYSKDYLATKDGQIYNKATDRFLKPSFSRVSGKDSDWGYYYVNVKRADGSQVKQSVHILVCTAHHGVKPDGVRMTVDHIDRDVSNNSAANLRWVEQRENNRNRGNHVYIEHKGVSMIAAEILEAEGVVRDSREWHYLWNRMHINKDSYDQAKKNFEDFLASPDRVSSRFTTAKPFELRSELVTGIWFPSFKSASDSVGCDPASLRYRLRFEESFENLCRRFKK